MMDDKNTTAEIWKEIPGESQYLVSNLGNVKSLNYNGRGIERILKQSTATGYKSVTIHGKCRYVHRLVAEAFIPNTENKPQVDHINSCPHDNRADNLQWVTREENVSKYLASDKFKQISEQQRREYREQREQRNKPH